MSPQLTAPEQASGSGRFVPGVGSIVDGARRSAGVDVRAALTVWAVVVPQSSAHAMLAGVPSVHGLHAAAAAMAAYAVLGTSRDLNMGAERPLQPSSFCSLRPRDKLTSSREAGWAACRTASDELHCST